MNKRDTRLRVLASGLLAELCEKGRHPEMSDKDRADWKRRFDVCKSNGTSLTWPKFVLWLLSDPIDGTARLAKGKYKAGSKRVIALFRKWVKTGVAPDANTAEKVAYAVDVGQSACAAAWAIKHPEDGFDVAYAAQCEVSDKEIKAHSDDMRSGRHVSAARSAEQVRYACGEARKKMAEKLLELLRGEA